MVEWEAKYETGVEDVDKQHQSLFEYINLMEECIEDKTFEGTRIEIILNFFQMFAATHFSLEETCMLRTKCPAYDINQKAHKQFLEYYKSFRVKYKASDEKLKLLKEFHGVMIKWLSGHIMKIDMQLKQMPAA